MGIGRERPVVRGGNGRWPGAHPGPPQCRAAPAAMQKVDDQDLDETPEKTAAATALVATEAVHPARPLQGANYPPSG